jgi:transcription initiation factor TFIIIB Brf1 subunit/transcription initiation factor TFIIB
MLHIALSSVPSPLAQAAVYMAGILAGYLLLTQPEEWARVRETVREVWERRWGG